MKQGLIFILLFTNYLYAQQTITYSTIKDQLIDLHDVANGNEDFTGYEPIKELLADAQIVLLGEQSHGDGTTYDTKVKLIKYLHQELDFDIIAFESSFYECQKAWQWIQEGVRADSVLGKSVFSLWSTTDEFKPLVQYIESQVNTDHPLIVAGFDNQFTGNIARVHYVDDLKKVFEQTTSIEPWEEAFQTLYYSIDMIGGMYSNKYKKKDAQRDLPILEAILTQLETTTTDEIIWHRQYLKNVISLIKDWTGKEYKRDDHMANNLIWLKNQYPNKKIIGWGATSHFIHHSSEVKVAKNLLYKTLIGKYYQKNDMMGDHLKEKYGDQLATIGFIAYEGEHSLFRKRTLDAPKPNTVEALIAQSPYENCLLPLHNKSTAPLLSRPLGYVYIDADLSKIMDMVIFNRQMRRPKFDREFFKQMYPENKWIK